MKIGILRESKKPPDKRVPFSPEQCKSLVNKYSDLNIIVQPSNIRCFKDVKIDLSSTEGAKMWLVIVGNNGVGKTSMLRSIAMGLCDLTGTTSLLQYTYGDWIRKGAKKGFIEIKLIHKNKRYFARIGTLLS